MGLLLSRDGLEFRCTTAAHYDHAIRLISRYTGPLANVVDIGACAGGVSLYAAKRGAENVYAYEPDPAAFATLMLNITNNGFPNSKGIHPFQTCVLAGCNCADKLQMNWIAQGQGSVVYSDQARNVSPHLHTEVATVSFASIAEEVQEIDYLKIDIEGGEYCLADDAFFEIVKNHVRFLDIELHPLNHYFDKESALVLPRYRGDVDAMSILRQEIESCGLTTVYTEEPASRQVYLGLAKYPEEFQAM